MAYLSTLVSALSSYRASNRTAKVKPPIPMPDEEALRKSKRRVAALGTGRASTILTETDGLGG